jgi:YVTN family beta-propeller protein
MAANPITNRLYVASRNNDQLLVLHGSTHAVIGQVPTGDQPFGVAADPITNKVYVTSYQDGKLTVIDGATNQAIKTLTLAPELTYVAVNTALNRVYAVSHQANRLYVLNGATDTVIRQVNTGQPGAGAFGLAVSETLSRVYVTNRDSQDIFVFDGEGNVLPGQQVKPVPVGAVPFAMGFNPVTNRLYVMVGPDNRVDRVQVFQASAGGLSLVAKIQVDPGGEDGGGGAAVDTTANRIVVSNAAADTASVIDGESDRLITTLATGDDPFGVAFNEATGAIYVGNRLSDDLTLVRGQ